MIRAANSRGHQSRSRALNLHCCQRISTLRDLRKCGATEATAGIAVAKASQFGADNKQEAAAAVASDYVRLPGECARLQEDSHVRL
jgi:hypothetical protein